MSKVLLSVLFILLSGAMHAQYVKGSQSYIGIVGGRGSVHGTATLISNDYRQGTFKGRSRFGGMASQFSHYGKGEGFGIGGYFGVNLGMATASSYLDNTGSNKDGKWVSYSEFDLYVDMRLGLQVVFKKPGQEMLAGFRYFYWANSDGLRSWYTNADETGAIGFFGAWKKIGFELNMGSPKIPLILTNARWNMTQLELRYKAGTLDSDNYAFMIGLRGEHSKYQHALPAGAEKIKANSLSLLLLIGTN